MKKRFFLWIFCLGLVSASMFSTSAFAINLEGYEVETSQESGTENAVATPSGNEEVTNPDVSTDNVNGDMDDSEGNINAYEITPAKQQQINEQNASDEGMLGGESRAQTEEKEDLDIGGTVAKGIGSTFLDIFNNSIVTVVIIVTLLIIVALNRKKHGENARKPKPKS